MTTLPATPPSDLPALLAQGTLSPADLGELMQAFNDVTARLVRTHEGLQHQVEKLQEELREANEQVERSRRLAALGQMAAGISHEVRNPLGSILLYARMLQNDLRDQPASRQIADKIAGAVQRLDAVVGDVLAFSREMRVRPADIDAADALRHALDAARWAGGEWEGLIVSGPEGGAIVHADASLLHQALVNLIRNAVQAMSGTGGEVRGIDGAERACAAGASERAKCLTLSVAATDMRLEDGAVRPMIALRIEDSGPGVPPEALERLFNPFFTTRATGTGLGLAIVHRIIDAQGGRVSIRNREDRGQIAGATAEILLPAYEREPVRKS